MQLKDLNNEELVSMFVFSAVKITKTDKENDEIYTASIKEIKSRLDDGERAIELLRRARNYTGLEGYPCPLCIYKDGRFLSACGYHNRFNK